MAKVGVVTTIQHFPIFLLAILVLLQSSTHLSTPHSILSKPESTNATGDADIPIYDSDGDGVNDANDSHPFKSALSQHIIGGAPIEEWNTTPAYTINVPKLADHSEFLTNMVWGDIDNDGDADLLYSVADGRNRIYLNDGDGNLAVSWIEPTNYRWTWGAALVDINQDGWLDVVFSDWNGGGDCSSINCGYMLLNNNGTFNNTPNWNKTGTTYNMGMGTGDFDGDNDIDIYFAADSSEIFLNENGNLTANSTWTETPNEIVGALGFTRGYSTTFDVESADFDRDGDVDIIQANGWMNGFSQLEGHNMLWSNNGNGTFGNFNNTGSEIASWASWHANVTSDIELADLDGDGFVEIIAAENWRWNPQMGYRWNAPNHIYSNNNGSFDKNASWSSTLYRPSSAVAVGDLDMDGDPDLVFANGWPEEEDENGNWIVGRNRSDNVYTNNNGTITSLPTWFNANLTTSDVEFVDYDGDKDLDMVFARHLYENQTIHTNILEFYENPWSNVDKDDWGDDDDDCPTLAGNSTEDRKGCPDTDSDGWSDPDSGWTWGMGADRFANNSDQHIDTDGDGWGDNSNGTDGDACPVLWGNSTQGGVLGCIDSDGDDWADSIDWDVGDKTQWADEDSDSYGDNPVGTNGDDCPGEWGNSTQGGVLGCIDSDGDDWADNIDWDANDSSQWADSDSDGWGDATNGTLGDDCPEIWGNSTENGTLGCIDSDGDGWTDGEDWDANDSTQWADSDGDGWGDSPSGTLGDDCPGIWGNSTIDGVLGCLDDDGDGWANLIDAFENDSTQWADGDGDGYGDNPLGTNADDCPEQFGVSTLDFLGCADWDSDGVSNTNDPDPFDATLAFDPDGDDIDSSIDNCPDDSNPNQEDYDGNGLGDVCDLDDDSDSIPDLLDRCPMGEMGWNSSTEVDVDGDGCRDLTEDLDDDGDGVDDGADLCINNAATYTGWLSNNGSGNSSNATDWDGDGCEDATGEDIDDDNDGVDDTSDICQYSSHGWKSTPTTDEDSDGCEDISQDSDGDGTIDKFDQCPNTAANNTVDDRGCSTIQIQDTITESNDATDDLSFNEKLMTGDLDAIGLILAIFVPIIGVGLTVMFQQRKRSHIKRLRRLIQSAETKGQLHEAKALLRKSVSGERLTQGQYNLLLEEIDAALLEIDEDAAVLSEETKEKGQEARSKSKDHWQKAVADELKDDSYRVDEEGIEWWEDEKKQWWYRRPEEESWEKWED